jgi:hypothetical protein
VRPLVRLGAEGAWASAGLVGVVSVFVGFGLAAISGSASAESAALTASAIWAALGWDGLIGAVGLLVAGLGLVCSRGPSGGSAGLMGALCAGRGWAGLMGGVWAGRGWAGLIGAG